jgi:hypothetical protein
VTNDLRGTTSAFETWCLRIEQDGLNRRRRVRRQGVGARSTIEDIPWMKFARMSLQGEHLLVYLANISRHPVLPCPPSQNSALAANVMGDERARKDIISSMVRDVEMETMPGGNRASGLRSRARRC